MTSQHSATEPTQALFGNLLDERLLYYRHTDTSERVATTLPELFVAMAQDHVRDFPALRPHQRHPWHAFLVQLAAIALHSAGRTQPFATPDEWRAGLLALTPNDPDGAAWCLVSPAARPAFMQAPEPSGNISSWKNNLVAADELDMLVTSKNHDLKAGRMWHNSPEDWVYALISLQTQEGVLGSGNYGISRMNRGYGSRCGVGIVPNGNWGKRWARDLQVLGDARAKVVKDFDLRADVAHALVWVLPWDGADSLSFSSLDPWFIEICRRVRLTHANSIRACTTSSNTPRITAKELNGVTGDPWMPVDAAAAKALTIGRRGFDYELATELLLGTKFIKPSAQMWLSTDDTEGVYLLAQGVARGQGKTEGFHERRIPLSRKVRQALLSRNTDELAKLAGERIYSIGAIFEMLKYSLTGLFGNGAPNGKDKNVDKTRVRRFAQPFEAQCDAQFFPELIDEIEADDREAVREKWLLALAERAKRVLQSAFDAGPRSGQLRYRAQSAALGRLNADMRGSKLPALAQALKSVKPTPFTSTDEETHEHA